MIKNSRFGIYRKPVEGFILQVHHYYRQMAAARAASPNSLLIVDYSKLFEQGQALIGEICDWVEAERMTPLSQEDFAVQYGPPGHKADPTRVRGIGRWRFDLDSSEAELLWHELGEQYEDLLKVARVVRRP